MSWEIDTLVKYLTDAVKNGVQLQLDQLAKEFNSPVMNIVKTQWVTSNCSDIIFINYTPLSVAVNGDIQVNNYVLQPGGYFGVMGNNAEINKDSYNVVFNSAATNCVVIKKLYTKK